MDNKMTAEQALMKELQNWRAERPDEWKMDEIIRLAEKALSAPSVPDGWIEDAEAVIRANQDDANRSSSAYFQNMAVIMARRIKSLTASPEPVAPDDTQQLIADLRAEVEALKDWQRKHRHAAELDTVDMVCLREALDKIQRIADGYVSAGELPVMVVIQTICRQALAGGSDTAQPAGCLSHNKPCTYPDCKCPFDMGADNKCLKGAGQ